MPPGRRIVSASFGVHAAISLLRWSPCRARQGRSITTSAKRLPACKARSGNTATCQGSGMSQVMAAGVLSVVVRSCSVVTAVNGTLVARPVMLTRADGRADASNLDCKARAFLGGHCVVGKPRTRRGSSRHGAAHRHCSSMWANSSPTRLVAGVVVALTFIGSRPGWGASLL